MGIVSTLPLQQMEEKWHPYALSKWQRKLHTAVKS